MSDNCGNCRFYDQWKDLDYGACRRYPPAVLSEIDDPNEEGCWHFPAVGRSNLCGEHKPANGEPLMIDVRDVNVKEVARPFVEDFRKRVGEKMLELQTRATADIAKICYQNAILCTKDLPAF